MLLREFKERWERVKAFERNECRKLSMEERFHQIESLMQLGLGLGFKKDKGKDEVRTKWVFLKKGNEKEI